MAGTDKTKRAAREHTPGGGPVIILVGPQLAENIGMAARAMLNFGLTEMRLVRPRPAWPNEHAINTASGADAVLDGVRVFDDTRDAVADLHRLVATTARLRDMVKTVEPPRTVMARLRGAVAAGERCGILFGPERTGLDNDDMALAETLVNVPANPAFSSLNLAHSVLLMAYEWYQASGAAPMTREVTRRGLEAATLGDVVAFFEHLERELDACGFLRVTEKRPRMVRSIRNIFNRIRLTDQEVRTLRGIVSGLASRRER